MIIAKPPERILVLDFDGTVCLGDAPVFAYATELARYIQNDWAKNNLVYWLTRFLAETDRLTNTKQYPEIVRELPDGYAVAATLARDAGLEKVEINSAYLASRKLLADGKLETYAPPGLAEFLADFRALRVLVTNAPGVGVDAQLIHLGIAEHIDLVIADAGKPQRMGEILAKLIVQNDLMPGKLLSVGDIWCNDLEPAWQLGCATAFIDRHGAGHGSPDFRAARFESLYSKLSRWADSQSG